MSVNGANEAGVAKKFVADNQKQIPKQNVTTPLPHQNTKWPKNYNDHSNETDEAQDLIDDWQKRLKL